MATLWSEHTLGIYDALRTVMERMGFKPSGKTPGGRITFTESATELFAEELDAAIGHAADEIRRSHAVGLSYDALAHIARHLSGEFCEDEGD